MLPFCTSQNRLSVPPDIAQEQFGVVVIEPGGANSALVVSLDQIAVGACTSLAEFFPHFGEINSYVKQFPAPSLRRNELHRVANFVCGDEPNPNSTNYRTT